MRRVEVNPNLAVLGVAVSVLSYWALFFTKNNISVSSPYEVINPYIVSIYKTIWYLSFFIFLQSVIIIVNGEYNKKESNYLFWVQIIIIFLSEWANIVQSIMQSFK